MTEGFSIIPNWVIRDSDLTQHELLVYMSLLNHSNEKGYAWPSYALIAHEARCSVSTVKATIAKLVQRGVVQKQERRVPGKPNLSNMYRVSVFDRSGPARGQEVTPRGQEVTGEGAGGDPEEEPLEEEPEKKTEGQRSAPTFHADNVPVQFDLDDLDPLITEAQIQYLRDIVILHGDEVPDPRRLGWHDLYRDEASRWIDNLLAKIPRGTEYAGPERGEPAYDELSERGRELADQRMQPQP